MEIDVHKSKDFFAGLLFVFFGLLSVWISRDYPMGSAGKMGPGYFPTILGGTLALFGFIISIRSLWVRGEPIRLQTFRPLVLIVSSVIAFAMLVNPLGLVLATFVLVFLSTLGGGPIRLGEGTLLFLILALISALLFVYGLGLSFTLWPSLWISSET